MIRRAEEKDIEGVLKLLYQVNEVHALGRPDLFKLGGQKYTKEALLKIFSDENTPVFVSLDENEKVLGYLFGIYEIVNETTSLHYRKVFYIDDLCVDKEKRHMHIGEELYKHACKFAKENGCFHVTLHVWELNEGARKFYEKMGMKPLNTTMETIL